MNIVSYIKKGNRDTDRGITLIVFVVTFVFLYCQFNAVMVYFDDFAYYSLSYSPGFKHVGQYFTFAELFTFLKSHYFDCNGRLLYYFLWLTLFRIGGLTLVRLGAALIVTAVLYILYRFCEVFLCGNYNQGLTAILVTSLYWVLDIVLLRQGIYWFAAFFHYVTPIVFLVLFAVLYFSGKQSFKKRIFLCLLLFLSSFSQEQQSITTIFFSILIVLYGHFIRKERIITNLPYIFAAVAGCLIIFSSPALWNRLENTTNGTGFFSGILQNLKTTIYIFFTTTSWRYNVILFLSLILLSMANFRSTVSRRMKLWDILCIIVYGVLVYLYLLRRKNIELFFVYSGPVKIIITGLLLATSMITQILRYHFIRRNYPAMILAVTALLSVACLAMVPTHPNRLMTLPTFLLFPVIVQGILVDYRSTRIRNIIAAVFCLFVVYHSIVNGTQIYSGYAANKAVYLYNESQILAEKYDYDQNQDPIDIRCKILPDNRYSAGMVYEEDYEYMIWWMDKYYLLPYDTEYHFE